MAVRHILDAAALYSASREVASRHAVLRGHQIDAYSKTSSLANAVRNRTDRLSLTLQAASNLSQRLIGSTSISTDAQETNPNKSGSFGSPKENSDNIHCTGSTKEGLQQDHFYERSEANAITENRPDAELAIVQEKAVKSPLPDGSLPSAALNTRNLYQYPRDSATANQTELVAEYETDQSQDVPPQPLYNTSASDSSEQVEMVSANEVRRIQHQAKSPIPSISAEPPAVGQSSPQTRATKEAAFDQENSLFSNASSRKDPASLASLRSKRVAAAEVSSANDQCVPNGQTNQEVFDLSGRPKQAGALPESQAVPEQDPAADAMFSEIFHSPRVAKLLAKRKSLDRSDHLKLQGVDDVLTSSETLKSGLERDQDTFNTATPSREITAIPQEHIEQSNEGTQTQMSGDDVRRSVADLSRHNEESAPIAEIDEPTDFDSAKDSYQLRQSPVPSSRLSRFWQYGGLATSMAFGAVEESFRRAAGTRDDKDGSLLLSASNMDRLVAKLSRMRGAALKLGQMMSFQDSKMIPAPIHQVLLRVQDSADYMPSYQRDQVLQTNLGTNWRDLFDSFDECPVAAASIGQVHGAVLKSTGQRVAVKVQYPGVANSIDSDLSNLSVLLTASRLLPKGLYLDKTIANARTELAWECDYIREAECARRFKKLLRDEQDIFVVPNIVDEASGGGVLTMERMEGVGVTKVQDFNQEQKDWIGTQILRLCLREIIEFRFMQTDPNWTNFLYNAKTQKLELLDFGASREYPDQFIGAYVQNLLAASRNDHKACRDLSIRLGYLTGHESQAMLKAHINSVMTLAEPFQDSSPEVYDFRDQTITGRVKSLIPLMIRERLAPPPEETYSLHRKLSGAFLLCARLGSRVRCKDMFQSAMQKALIT